MTHTVLPSYGLLRDPVAVALIEIEDAIDDGSLDRAADRLNSLRTLAKQDVRVHLVGTRLAEQAGNPLRARESAERALAVAPADPRAQIDVALYCAASGEVAQWREASALLEAALDNTRGQALTYRSLERAVRAANLIGRLDLGARWLGLAADRWPKDARIAAALGENAWRRGDPDSSRIYYERALSIDPDHVEAKSGLAYTLRMTGDLKTAETHFEDLLRRFPNNSEYSFALAVCRGETPDAQPAEIVEALFDAYAERFDAHLLLRLGYRAPQWAADRIMSHYPDRKASILDLGCGTRLLGYCLPGWMPQLVGVDLSEAMLKRAAKWRAYARLHKADLRDVLRDSPADSFDSVVAIDVFIYVGRLDAIMWGISRVLRPYGLLLFTVEAALPEEGEFAVRPSGRYASSELYIRSVLEAAGFGSIDIQKNILRFEGGKPLEGYFVEATNTRTVAAR